MAKFKVSLDMGYGEPPDVNIYEAETPAKAKYMCYKDNFCCNGNRLIKFMEFIELFSPLVERVNSE